mmetsp:Transcript_28317/g.74337  ORF Transcript_28317/g.74337 Transcript_28317/m.74337 type:complete len:250 (-) Transcript_28317:298-1047(-)
MEVVDHVRGEEPLWLPLGFVVSANCATNGNTTAFAQHHHCSLKVESPDVVKVHVNALGGALFDLGGQLFCRRHHFVVNGVVKPKLRFDQLSFVRPSTAAYDSAPKDLLCNLSHKRPHCPRRPRNPDGLGGVCRPQLLLWPEHPKKPAVCGTAGHPQNAHSERRPLRTQVFPEAPQESSLRKHLDRGEGQIGANQVTSLDPGTLRFHHAGYHKSLHRPRDRAALGLRLAARPKIRISRHVRYTNENLTIL